MHIHRQYNSNECAHFINSMKPCQKDYKLDNTNDLVPCAVTLGKRARLQNPRFVS